MFLLKFIICVRWVRACAIIFVTFECLGSTGAREPRRMERHVHRTEYVRCLSAASQPAEQQSRGRRHATALGNGGASALYARPSHTRWHAVLPMRLPAGSARAAPPLRPADTTAVVVAHVLALDRTRVAATGNMPRPK